MKIKVDDLEGDALNWAVRYAKLGRRPKDYVLARDNFTACWNKAGPLIEVLIKCGCVLSEEVNGWPACRDRNRNKTYRGETVLVAALRCHVAMSLGEEVDVPDALLPDTSVAAPKRGM